MDFENNDISKPNLKENIILYKSEIINKMKILQQIKLKKRNYIEI